MDLSFFLDGSFFAFAANQLREHILDWLLDQIAETIKADQRNGPIYYTISYAHYYASIKNALTVFAPENNFAAAMQKSRI